MKKLLVTALLFFTAAALYGQAVVVKHRGGGSGIQLLSNFPLLAVDGSYTTSEDTTGATLIVVYCASLGTCSTGSIVDTASNSWTGGTDYGSGGTAHARILYKYAPTISATHQFKCTATDCFIVVWAVKGTTGSTIDVQDGHTTAQSSPFTAGATGITPTNTGEFLVAGATSNSAVATLSINSGFSTPLVNSNGTYEVGGASYLIDSANTAINPTWTANKNTDWRTAIAAFY